MGDCEGLYSPKTFARWNVFEAFVVLFGVGAVSPILPDGAVVVERSEDLGVEVYGGPRIQPSPPSETLAGRS